MNSMFLLGLTLATLQKPPQGWEWRADLQGSLPESIRILQREDTRLPLRARLVEDRPEKAWRPEAGVPAKLVKQAWVMEQVLGGEPTTLVVRENVVDEPCDLTGERPATSILRFVTSAQ
jgi:hypothetical protein